MTVGINIRPMQFADVDAVYAIESTIHASPWGPDLFFECVRFAYDCRVLECQKETQRVIVGYVISRYDERVCHVLNLSIAIPFQGQGLGQQLLQHVMSSPAEKAVDRFSLEVRPSNAKALRLYYRLGFSLKTIKEAYYEDNDGIEDALVLEKYNVPDPNPING